MLRLILSVSLVTLPLAAAECSRASLQEIADKYIGSQMAGELDDIFADADYKENNRDIDITDGVISTALDIVHKKSILDTTECATYSELIVTDPADPYVIGTQIRVDEDGAVTLIDSVATTTGDWLFNASTTLEHIEEEDWSPIEKGARDSRKLLKDAADAYLDLWGNEDSPVPWGQPCRRLEGSAYTGSGEPTDQCNVGIPGGDQPPVSGRRYVVDETMGSVNVLCTFEVMRDGPDSHEFRLVNGKLRYVHTMTVMRDLD